MTQAGLVDPRPAQDLLEDVVELVQLHHGLQALVADRQEELVQQLVDTAQKQTLSSTLEGKTIEELGLKMIHNATVDIELNGYSVSKPVGSKSTSVSLAQVYELAQEKIIQTLQESEQKILPQAHSEIHSFMFMFYQVLKYLHPNTSEICLVDITSEATEIGIVRDNVLRHTTHIPIGLYTISREIALACGIPKEEAYSLMKSGTDALESTYGQVKKAEIEAIFAAYEEKLGELFSQTGDSLSIPKTLFLHTSSNTEAFFSKCLKNGVKKATGGAHSVHLFTSELLGKKEMTDTALALSAHYFHTKTLYPLLSENMS